MPEPAEVADLVAAVRAGDRRALAKAITLVESARADHAEAQRELLRLLLPYSGGAVRVGVSGAPGVGKSTFIEALGLELIHQGRQLAVLAVDPSSAISGGSILGDKTRMPELAASPNAFIRPTAAGTALGGVARRTRETLLMCEAAGFDIVLVETVGAGQNEHAVSGMVDTFVLLLIAGAGDELQGIKRGIVEVSDVFVVNKADGDNHERAEALAASYRSALSLLRSAKAEYATPVITASALERRGMADVWREVEAHRNWLLSSGQFEDKRKRQGRAWLDSLIDDGLRLRFRSHPDVQARYASVRSAVEDGLLTPGEAAEDLLRVLDP